MNSIYEGLTAEQRRKIDAMTPEEFLRYAQTADDFRQQDIPVDELTDFNRKTLGKKGQTVPSSRTAQDRDFGLEPVPDRQPTQVDAELGRAGVLKFLAEYPQVARTMQNEKLLYGWLTKRGALITYQNLVVSFQEQFDKMTLRQFDVVAEPAETQLRTVVNGKQRHREPAAFFPGKVIPTRVEEVLLSPTDVSRLSADEHARLMEPTRVPVAGVLSASEYAETDEFKSENPPPSRMPVQERGAKDFEIRQFLNHNPAYLRFAQMEGVETLVQNYLDSCNEPISEIGIKDAFRFLESQGLFGKIENSEKGLFQTGVTTIHVNSDKREHYTRNKALNAATKDISAADFKILILSDAEYRNDIDRSA